MVKRIRSNGMGPLLHGLDAAQRGDRAVATAPLRTLSGADRSYRPYPYFIVIGTITDRTRLPHAAVQDMNALGRLLSWRHPLVSGVLLVLSGTQLRGQDTTHADTTRAAAIPLTPPRTTGTVELGGIYGAIPFATPGSSLWNAFARGRIGADLLGLPIGVQFDVGTDVPLRGQRNKVRFFFDPARAAEQDHWRNAHLLHAKEDLVDSLEQERARLDRILIGQQARVLALREAAQVPSAAHGSLDTLSSPLDSASVTMTLPEGPADSTRQALLQRADTLEQGLGRVREQLNEVNAALEAARSAYELQQAVSRADGSKLSWPLRFARGIRTLELGTCTPQGSEFLINGTTLQGISFAYVHKDLFIAIDHGRSFDDTWRNTDPVGRAMEQVQRSLFLVDVRDLNPRRLTDLRVGTGPVDGTHFHVGYLYGKRDDVTGDSAAVPIAGPGYRTNHVVELDAGLAIRPGHVVRLVHARSVVLTAPVDEASDVARPSVNDLFNEGAEQAWKASWTSDLHRTGTRLAAEGRYISPWFQSFGVGFLRSGTRAGELRVDQTLGQRLRVRAKGTLEQRTVPHAEEQRTMDHVRGQVGLSWKPLRVLTLHATYLPVVTQWADGPQSRTDCYQAGAEVRKRWRGTVLFISANSGLYQWTASPAPGQEVWNHGLSSTLTVRERWNLGVSYTTLTTVGTDTLPPAGNLGIRAGHRGKDLTIEASAQLPMSGPLGWCLVAQRPIGKDLTLGLRGERYANYPALFHEGSTMEHPTDQAWSMSLTYHW